MTITRLANSNSNLLNMKKQIAGVFTCLASTTIFMSVDAQELPNVVFIFADDMGYGDVSVNNPESRIQTPAIDRLAEQGIRFTEAHSAGAVCTPSRYSLLTGRYFFRTPKQEGYWGYLPPYIEPERETIGDVFIQGGYTTACIGKWHLGLNWVKKNESLPLIAKDNSNAAVNVDFHSKVSGGPRELGFDHSYIMPASLDMPPYLFIKNDEVVDPDIIMTAEKYPNRLDDTKNAWDRKNTNEQDIYWERGVWWRNGEMSESFKFEDCLDIIAKEGLDFIEQEAKSKSPFFLYLPLTGPHTPWLPNNNFKGSTALGTYGDFIAHIDNIVDQITTKLSDLGIEENTMVVFSSDNGAAWQEEDVLQYAHQSSWGRRGMKGDAWDGGHRIPLIIKWPKVIKPKSEYNFDVSLVDFFATFSELTSYPLEDNVAEDSYSFLKVLKGNLNDETRDHYISVSSSGRLAIKKGDWKYIEGLGSAGFSSPTRLDPVKNGPRNQLYNMRLDILESHNLILSEQGKAKEMDSILQKFVRQGYSRPLN